MSEKWTITFDNDMHGNSWWQIDADDRSVADVYEAKDTVLIAAAPDLLAACEACVEAWDKTLQLEKTDVALVLAKTAITKAKGK